MSESSVRIHGALFRELSVGARQRTVDSELPFGSCAAESITFGYAKGATGCLRHKTTHWQMCVRLVSARGG